MSASVIQVSSRRRLVPPVLAGVVIVLLIAGLAGALFIRSLVSDLPSLAQLENPSFRLAAVAYSADGYELARFSTENRSWASYEIISPFVIQALIATEDRRFRQHRGIDYTRTVSAIGRTILARLGAEGFRTEGGSTITQQLARNLYNEQIGFERSVERKIREMLTARQLEERYTKDEILELYLNTVQFGYNSYGIETAARTYFGVSAAALSLQQSATLVGMLQATTRYNPVRNPEAARGRRDLVLGLMASHGFISDEARDAARREPVGAAFRSAAITSGPAPHFAQVLRDWLTEWGKREGVDVLSAGLRVHTTIDSRLQGIAQDAVRDQMEGLEAVVGYEWSRADDFYLGGRLEDYPQDAAEGSFSYLWESRTDLVDAFIRESSAYRRLRAGGASEDAAVEELRGDARFLDSLSTAKTRLEAGMVSIDPHSGAIRVWVGGRDMTEDWNDHVAGTRRQPGSTFKPFVYTAAVDNGYAPTFTLPDRPFTYTGSFTQRPWSPTNFGGSSGGDVTLSRALATSNNIITARVITELVTPPQVAFYARRMGVQSPLLPVASLGLGTSDVTLLEMTAAYSTLASGGHYNEPHFVSRIENRDGEVLYEAPQSGVEVLSRQTAYTVVEMLRGTVEHGTAVRLRGQFSLGAYDLAAKTGTTQNNADGWFVLMHPDLVTGAWVGFNDRRLSFRSRYWGQGAHNALFLVGTFFRKAVDAPETLISNVEFPGADEYGLGPKPASSEPVPVRVLTGRPKGE